MKGTVTEQMNIRLSHELIADLNIVSNLLKVNRSEWVKTKLAEEIHREKSRLLMELSTLYAKGIIAKQQLTQLVGKKVADEMEFVKKKSMDSARKGRKHGRESRKT